MQPSPTTETTIPEPEKAESVLLLPGHLFFVESVELPPALETDEVADFAELSIEGIAPFPIEQLNWGFLHSEGASSILIYATHRDRLKQIGVQDIDQYVWVLPDFAALQGAHFPDNTEIALIYNECVTLLYFESGSEVPYAVASSNKHDQVTQCIESLRAELEPVIKVKSHFQATIAEAVISEQGIPTFHFAEEGTTVHEDYGHWTSLSPNEKTLWQSDVRTGAFKEAERNARRTSALLTKITAWAALCAILLIGFEIALLAANAWLNTQKQQVATQQPTVARIEDKQTLMNKLEQVAQNELRPIAMLDALNQTRPDKIHFTSTETGGENRITIDGVASTINDLNRYTESLSKSGTFSLIGTPKYITRGGTTTFTATLDYTHKEAEPAATVEETAAPDTNATAPDKEANTTQKPDAT